MNESASAPPVALLALLLALLLAACAARAGARRRSRARAWAAPFTLTDQNGRRVSDRDFAGKYRLVYFGYTFCPDVCPVDMQVIGAGLRRFEAQDAGARRQGPADLHQRRSRARHAAGAAPVRRRLPPAPDRPHRQRGGDRPGRPRLSASSTSAARPAPGGGYMVNHTRHGGALRARRPADRDRSRTTRARTGVAAELERWVR